MVSAPAGITDVLLGLATRAVAGEKGGKLGRDVASLRARYHKIHLAAIGAKGAGGEVAAEIDRSFDELARLLSSLAALKELTARTRDFVAAAASGCPPRCSRRRWPRSERPGLRRRDGDRVHGWTVRRRVAEPGAHRHGRAQAAAAAGRGGQGAGRPRVHRQRATAEDDAGGAEERAAATLGRGGSDLTATLLGRALGAREVSLWKDVPGLLTADPRVVPDARVIPQLHLREAAELAYYGAKVLHPRALIPVAGRPMPVFVRPFGDPNAPGTEISARRTLDKYPVKALSAADGRRW